MNKQEYARKFKDPRWQKKRLEIMERDEFACVLCGDEHTTLNVHHCHYIWGNDPWDYEDEMLTTLCEPCHEIETHWAKYWRKEFGDEIGKNGLLAGDYRMLTLALRSRFQREISAVHVRDVIAHVLENDAAWDEAQESFNIDNAESE
jgi:hypothetical protein